MLDLLDSGVLQGCCEASKLFLSQIFLLMHLTSRRSSALVLLDLRWAWLCINQWAWFWLCARSMSMCTPPSREQFRWRHLPHQWTSSEREPLPWSSLQRRTSTPWVVSDSNNLCLTDQWAHQNVLRSNMELSSVLKKHLFTSTDVSAAPVH